MELEFYCNISWYYCDKDKDYNEKSDLLLIVFCNCMAVTAWRSIHSATNTNFVLEKLSCLKQAPSRRHSLKKV